MGVGKETPSFDRPVKQQGLEAKTNNEPTLASYISSLLYILSVPTLLGVAYWGHTAGYYSYRAMVPVFAGLLIGTIAVAFLIMHLRTGQ
jgi:hypothetical protein